MISTNSSTFMFGCIVICRNALCQLLAASKNVREQVLCKIAKQNNFLRLGEKPNQKRTKHFLDKLFEFTTLIKST